MNQKLKKNLRERQNELFESMATILSGLASPTRIRLLHLLSQRSLTVEVLAKKIDQSVANTSMHLRKMLAANLVSVSSQGQKRLYTLNPFTLAFWESCQDFVQNLDPSLQLDGDEAQKDLDWLGDLKKAIEKAKSKEVVLLDARPRDEVLPESLKDLNILNIPSSEISQLIHKIPPDKPVLVFCRGRLCTFAAWTVHELRKHGIQAFRLNISWYALNIKLEETRT